MDILAVHLKAAYRQAITNELAALGIEKLRTMEVGKVYSW
jgi:hypothetical protein